MSIESIIEADDVLGLNYLNDTPPEREFSDRYNAVSDVNLPNDDGIRPTNGSIECRNRIAISK
jgi:hypothetical protein